jgi:hypothetical protein
MKPASEGAVASVLGTRTGVVTGDGAVAAIVVRATIWVAARVAARVAVDVTVEVGAACVIGMWVADAGVATNNSVGVARAEVGINGSRVMLCRVGLGVGEGETMAATLTAGNVGVPPTNWLNATAARITAAVMKAQPSQRCQLIDRACADGGESRIFFLTATQQCQANYQQQQRCATQQQRPYVTRRTHIILIGCGHTCGLIGAGGSGGLVK